MTWRVRADVALGAGRERLRAAGLMGDGGPAERVRGGAFPDFWIVVIQPFDAIIAIKRLDMRAAAYALAVQRVANATTVRGIYP